MDYKIIELDRRGDDDGWLVAVESFKNIPFDIKRMYYIFATKQGVVRGKHAHKNLEQLLICLNGSVTVSCYDGKNRDEFVLDNNMKALYIKDLVWHEMYDFSDGAVLIVLASNFYDESDYVRKYDDFEKLIGKKA